MTERVLTARELNRALLARQLLLERAPASIPRALERMGGLQAQYAPSMYIGLWSRLEGFQRDALTRALERRSVVQGTLMRSTIHLVSARDYWPLALAVERPRREWWLRANRDGLGARDMSAAARRLRPRLAGATLRRGEIEELVGKRPAAGVGHWLHLVRAPPSGTWERRRADLFALAEDGSARPRWPTTRPWTTRCAATWEPSARPRSARSPTGPASRRAPSRRRSRAWRCAASPPRTARSWSTSHARPLPDPRRRRPSACWGRGTRSCSPTHAAPRSSPSAIGHACSECACRAVTTFLVDGAVAGAWRYEDGRVDFDAFERLDRATLRALREEGERMAAFHA